MKKWLVGAGLAVGLAVGLKVGLNPGDGINLNAAWPVHQMVAGVSGAGNADGADGVALADFDGDDKLDVVSGFEQGLRLALAFNPGTVAGAVEEPWPHVIMPAVNMCSVEDAITCDVDADGALDIVAACETGTVRVEIMFAPTPPNTRSELLNAPNWTRVTLDASANRRSMRAACADWAGDSALEIIVGGKDAGVAAGLGYYSSATPRTGSSWTYTQIVPVGWVMQMYVQDYDGDTFLDIIYSDKEDITTPAPDATRRGVRWLDCTGADPPVCTERPISTVEGQWKWFDIIDWDGDTDLDIVACRSEPPSVHEQAIFLNAAGGTSWTEQSIPVPTGTGFCQHTTTLDIDGDGQLDIGTAYSNATNLAGMTWQKRSGPPLSPSFKQGMMSGILDVDSDTKFDNLEWADIDGDGDQDAITTEQHIAAGTGPGLGIVYFENPLETFVPSVAPPGIDCTALTSGVDAVAGTTAVTASVTPGANRLVLAAFQSALAASPATPTGVAGNGLTWVQVATQNFHATDRRVTVFRALGASPSAGAITSTWDASQTSKTWAIVECSGVDTGGTNGSGAVVQSVTAEVAAATSITATLAALLGPSSAHVSFHGVSISGAQTPDVDFEELTDVQTGTGVQGLASEWALNQTVVTPTFATANAGAVSVEVKVAP